MSNKNITLGQRGHDGKLSMAFIGSVNRAYAKLSIQLHQAACLAFYRVAQYGDPDALNAFYDNLRINDRTALKVWVAEHATYMDLENQEVRPWIRFKSDPNGTKGAGTFHVINGKEEYRKDMFTIDSEETGKMMLIMERPFYEKDNKDKDTLTIEALITMLARAAKNVKDKSTKEKLQLPADVLSLVQSIENCTAKELAALERVKSE